MGKTNYTILGIGLAGCLLLSLMMQHVLETGKERAVTPAAVTELADLLGSRMSEPPRYRRLVDGEQRAIGELTLYPLLSTNRVRVAREAGRFLWRNLIGPDRVDALVVVADDGLGTPTRWAVVDPDRSSSHPVLMQDGEGPFEAIRRSSASQRRPLPKSSGDAGAARGATASKPTREVPAADSAPAIPGVETSRPPR